MRWIRTILDVLLQLFRWRANATDPKLQAEKDYQKNHDDWEKKLKELEDAETKAGADWKLVVTGFHLGDVNRLRSEYLSASLAVGHHRASEPKREVSGPQ